MIKILMCDDEPVILREFAEVLRQACSDEIELRAAAHAQAALELMREGVRPDIAFLDILMPGMNGVELARAMRNESYAGEIVFLTNSNDFAYESYSVRAMGYLLKPVKPDEVRELMARYETQRKRTGRRITVGGRSKARMVPIADLAYVEVINHRLYFHMMDGSVLTEYSRLKDRLDELLGYEQMAQCNRSYVVNVDYVRAYMPAEIRMSDGTRIAITSAFKDFQDKCLEALFGEKDD